MKIPPGFRDSQFFERTSCPRACRRPRARALCGHCRQQRRRLRRRRCRSLDGGTSLFLFCTTSYWYLQAFFVLYRFLLDSRSDICHSQIDSGPGDLLRMSLAHQGIFGRGHAGVPAKPLASSGINPKFVPCSLFWVSHNHIFPMLQPASVGKLENPSVTQGVVDHCFVARNTKRSPLRRSMTSSVGGRGEKRGEGCCARGNVFQYLASVESGQYHVLARSFGLRTQLRRVLPRQNRLL